jgi:acetate kinase
MNKSSEAFKAYIDKTYVRPAVMNYMLGKKNESMSVNVNATLNSQSMENEIRGMRKDMRKRMNQSNKPDTRYSWHNQ